MLQVREDGILDLNVIAQRRTRFLSIYERPRSGAAGKTGMETVASFWSWKVYFVEGESFLKQNDSY